MPIISLMEMVDIIIMSAALGFIFSRYIKLGPRKHYDPLLHRPKFFDWQDFWFAVAITAPAIILHEFGHKFVALGFGFTASFHAAYMWLGIGVALSLMGTGFIFFIPAYVSILGTGTALQYSAIAFAGPGVNLVLWLGSWLFLKKKLVKKKYIPLVFLTSRINMFLFIFNMLPIPMFDGFKVYQGLIQAFF